MMETSLPVIKTCFIIDWSYLSRRYGLALNTSESVQRFIKGVNKQLADLLMNITTDKISKSIYLKVHSGAKVKPIRGHLFYEKGKEINPTAWPKFALHQMSAKTKEVQCEDCGKANILNKDQVDKNILTEMCEIVLESLHGEKSIDLFVFVVGDANYGEVMQLCKKHGAGAFLAGFKPDFYKSIIKEIYTDFIDLAKVESNQLIVKEAPKLQEDSIYVIGISIPMAYPTHIIVERLENHKLKPESMRSKEDKYKPGARFLKLDYKTKEIAEKAKASIDAGILGIGGCKAVWVFPKAPSYVQFPTPQSGFAHKPIIKPSVEENKVVANKCCLCKQRIEKTNISDVMLSCRHWAHSKCVISQNLPIGDYVHDFCLVCSMPIIDSDRQKCKELHQTIHE